MTNEANPLPWEEEGAVRRDVEPHRGDSLLWLARASTAMGGLAFCLLVPAVIGLPLALVVLVLAGRDMAKMKAGTLDPSGMELTLRARNIAFTGIWLNLLPFWCIPFGLYLASGMLRP